MRAVLEHIRTELAGICDDKGELDAISKALCLELLGIPQMDFWLKNSLEPDTAREARLHDALVRLKCGEPLQYVLGSTSFCGLPFKVGPDVLIPRPETAGLVEWAASYCKGRCGRLLDVGCGSGCISVCLASKLKDWHISAWDISDAALKISAYNARANGVDVEFESHDILATVGRGYSFDVIVSNPPYVTVSEKLQMERTVLDFEPELALFVPDSDPLLFYRAIAGFGLEALGEGGRLFLEINPLFITQLLDMLSAMGYADTEVRTDMFGKQRMISARLERNESR